jgi:Cu/Ag efflux pump CusA
MLRRLVRWCLHRPWLVAWSCVWLLALSALFVRDIPIDLVPDLAPAQATVQTDAPGLVPEQVEETVTDPIESALLGTPGVAHVDSRTSQGLSIVTLRFAEGADPGRVRQAVAENLARVGQLPAGASAPRLSPVVAPGPDLITIGLTSAKLDPMALRDLAQWTLRPRLLSTPGVARVVVYGGQVRRIEVRARPGDLSDSDLGFLDIVNAVRRATSVAGAGFIDTPNQRVLIEPHGQAETIDEVGLGQIQAPGGGDPTRIADVADVFEAPAPAFGDALVDGKPAVLLVVSRALGANAVETSQAVEQSLAVLQPSLAAQGVAVRTDLDKPAAFTAASTRATILDVAIGVGLASIALAIFMTDVRVVLITLAAAPLTLAAALVALESFGWTLNAMTLGGLAIGLALVIDDAVIDVESIIARLRPTQGRPALRRDAILAASLDVRSPVIYATVALALSLLPLLFLPGSERVLLAPLAAMIMIAALASLVVALAVTPALALLFLKRTWAPHPHRIVDAARKRQTTWLTGGGKSPWLGVLIAAGAALVVALALTGFRTELLPSIHDGHLVVETDAPASTSLDAARAQGAAIAGDLAALPGVRAVSQRIGRDATGDDGAGIEHSRIDVDLTPGLSDAAQADLAARVREAVAVYPGQPPLVRSRFDAGQSAGETPTSLQAYVTGDNLDSVDAGAGQVRAALAALPGRPAVRGQASAMAPVVRVDVNFDRLALYSLSSADVLDTVQAAFAGQTVAQIYEGPRVVDLAVTAQDYLRRDPEEIGNLLLRSSSGFSEPLSSVANVYLTDSRAVITHSGGLRSDLIEAAPRTGDIDRFASAARAAVARLTLPAGVFVDYDVVNSAARAGRDLAVAFALGLFAVFAFLSLTFDGRTAALVIGATLFALAGGVAAIFLMGGALSIGTMAGLVALVGLSMRSAVLLISRAEDLVRRGGAPWTLATVARAAGERLTPVVASAALVSLALAPLALQAGAAGHEILGPMAIVIIAGVIVGALADLTLLPVLLLAFWRPGPARRGRAPTPAG